MSSIGRKSVGKIFRPIDEMRQDVRAHIRYPQFMFALQIGAFASYHMKDPQVFYQGEDRWAIPPEIYSFGRRQIEAYYVVMQLPGMEEPEFVLMMPLVLSGREERVMVAWMAARCDEPNYGDLLVYTFPRTTVYGPWQVESRISQDAEISSQITLWSQAGSNVIRGNLLVIPLEDSLLYVEPLYLEAEDTGLPELRRVILSYGDNIVWGSNLETALAQLFGEIGVPAEGEGGEATTEVVEAAAEAASEIDAAVVANMRQTIERILQLDAEAEAARSSGDISTYFEKNQEQTGLLQQLQKEMERPEGAQAETPAP
ncbi:MAG TPA: hypothetical protein DEP45_13685 [Armatimonadetes bacterium]|nr:hypothetical protein [Armatimonadota bacterium]